MRERNTTSSTSVAGQLMRLGPELTFLAWKDRGEDTEELCSIAIQDFSQR